MPRLALNSKSPTDLFLLWEAAKTTVLYHWGMQGSGCSRTKRGVGIRVMR